MKDNKWLRGILRKKEGTITKFEKQNMVLLSPERPRPKLGKRKSRHFPLRKVFSVSG
jgi:hypothetical protein